MAKPKTCLDAIQTADLVNFLRDLAGESKHIPLTGADITLRAIDKLKFGIGNKTVPNLIRKLGLTCDRRSPAPKQGSQADRLGRLEHQFQYFAMEVNSFLVSQFGDDWENHWEKDHYPSDSWWIIEKTSVDESADID